MKDDPYSTLAGLDSRLYQDEKTSKTTKQRDNATTKPRTDESTSADMGTRPNEASGERTKEPTKRRSRSPAGQRDNEPTRTRVSPRTGHAAGLRIAERHSHDLFLDQVRWINRLKLDVEETHGARITGNQVVQLAIDLVREDYEQQAGGSVLIRSLVHGKRLSDLKISMSINEEET